MEAFAFFPVISYRLVANCNLISFFHAHAADTAARDPVEEALADLFGSDDEVIPVMKELLEERERKRQIMH